MFVKNVLFRFHLLTMLLVIAVIAHAELSDEDSIRAVRVMSNQAIANRDIDTLKDTWLPNLHVTASSGEVVTSGDEMARLFSVAFSDPDFITYVRRPHEITLSPGGSYAAESGKWISRRKSDNGEMSVEGIYLAQWHRIEAGWRIRSELFVTLSCIGSRACQNLP